jgi:hypothetical protein
VRWNSSDLACLLCGALGVLGVAWHHTQLTQTHHKTLAGRDAYALAPPEQVVLGSLGYRAALADLIFSHVVVSAGVHLREKRLFEFAPEYIETINALDPKFRDGYRFADAIITLQTAKVPPEMYRRARVILERGTRELPYDQELWLSAGQFLAYLAPAALDGEAEREAWRQQGARYLARACELIGSNESIPYQCYSAAALFSRAGNLAASRNFLERMRLMVDAPQLQAMIDAKLQSLAGDEVQQAARERAGRFERLWRSDLPFISRAATSAVGPRFDPFACAGATASQSDPVCATSFRDRLAEGREHGAN